MKIDTTEFAEFYRLNFDRIAGQLHAYLGDHAEAQDITQEAFCRALDRWADVSGYDHAASWVRHVAWNLATSRLRHIQVTLRHLSRQRLEHVDGPSPDRVALTHALAMLPPNHRLAVVLHYLGHQSAAEIAEDRGVAEGTVLLAGECSASSESGRKLGFAYLVSVPTLSVSHLVASGPW